MKILSLFLWLVAFIPVGFAQIPNIKNGITTLPPETIKILQQQEHGAAQKNTQQKQRVVMRTSSDMGAGTVPTKTTSDSFHFFYSGMRTSVFNYYYLTLNTGASSFDSCFFTIINGFGQRQRNHYDTNGNLDTATTIYNDPAGIIINTTRDIYSYNTNNQVTLYLQFNWDKTSAAWKPISQTRYRYDNLHRKMTDTTFSISNSIKTIATTIEHLYNTAGLLDSIVTKDWSNGFSSVTLVSIYSYYPNNYLKTTVAKSNYSLSKDSFAYATNNGIFTNHWGYYSDYPKAWFPYYNWILVNKSTRHLNAYQLPDTVREWVMNNGYFTHVAIYNSYGNVISTTKYEGPNVSSGLAYLWKDYYYETYDDPTPPAPNPSFPIIIYPNPATSWLNIYREQQSAAAQQAIIWNIWGQKVLQQTLATTPMATVNIEALASGVYWVTVLDTNGTLSERSKFVKQ